MAELDGWMNTDSWLLDYYHHTNKYNVMLRSKGTLEWICLMFSILYMDHCIYMENWSTTLTQYDKLKTIENAYGIEIQVLFSFKLMAFILQPPFSMVDGFWNVPFEIWKLIEKQKLNLLPSLFAQIVIFFFLHFCDYAMHSTATWHPGLAANYYHYFGSIVHAWFILLNIFVICHSYIQIR